MRLIARLIAGLAVFASMFAGAVGVAQEPKARLKIGVVNYGQLYSKYDRAVEVRRDLDLAMKPLKDEAESIKAGMRDAQAALEKLNISPEAGANLRAGLKSGAEKLANIELRARNEVMPKQEKALVLLWTEIKDAIADQANRRDFDLVLGYGDPAGASPDALANINRKIGVMDMGAAVPIFIRTGADITNDVLTELNDNYRKTKKPLVP